MGEQSLRCLSAGEAGRLVSSTGVRACSWTLQITDPSREVAAGEQVSWELTERSLVVWCYLVSIQSCHLHRFLSSLLFLLCRAGQFSFHPSH